MTGQVLIVEGRIEVARKLSLTLRECGFGAVGPATDIVSATNLLKNAKFDAAILSVDLLGRAAGYFAACLESASVPTVFISAPKTGWLPAGMRTDYVCPDCEDMAEIVDCLQAALHRKPYGARAMGMQLSLFDPWHTQASQ